MRLSKSIPNFELKKTVSKRNTIVILILVAILQIFIQVGKANYSDILENKETFQRQERQKASRYLHYAQYGSFGIWLRFIPHPNCILFFDSTFDNLYCNVNSTYVFNSYTPVKGRKYFSNRSRFLNFSVMFLLLGVLGCLSYGMDTTVKKDYLKFISIFVSPKKAFLFTIITRIIILFLTTIVLYVISVLPLLLFNGINLFSTSFPILLGIILLFLFFFSTGVVVGLMKKQVTRTLVLGVVYFSLVFLLPWELGFYSEISAKDMPTLIEFDNRNFNVLMQVEENWEKKHGSPKSRENTSEEEIKEFKALMIKMKKTFKDNEDRLKSQSLSKIKIIQTIASFFPTLFFSSICESIGSVGVIHHIDFHTYSQEKKEEFVDFIIKKRFPEKEAPSLESDKNESKKIENFIKGDADLFYSKPELPHNFWLGVILTIGYTIGLFFIGYKRIARNFKDAKGADPCITFENDQSALFLHCKDEEVKKAIFAHYNQQDGSTAVCKVNPDHFKSSMKPEDMVNHLCRITGIDENAVLENLKIMGLMGRLPLKATDDIIKKIYIAVRCAEDSDLYVFNELLRGETKYFESHIQNLFMHLLETGKKIIYLDTEIFDVASPLTRSTGGKHFRAFTIDDFTKLIFR